MNDKNPGLGKVFWQESKKKKNEKKKKNQDESSGARAREKVRNQEQKEEMNTEGRYSRSSMELLKVAWRILLQRRQ